MTDKKQSTSNQICCSRVGDHHFQGDIGARHTNISSTLLRTGSYVESIVNETNNYSYQKNGDQMQTVNSNHVEKVTI